MTDVLVVVDPSSARLVLPDGEELAERVARWAVADGGTSGGTVDGSLSQCLDEVARRLRQSSSEPLAVVDGALVTTRTVYGDVIAEPDDGSARILRDVKRHQSRRVLALRIPAAARSAVAERLAPSTSQHAADSSPLDVIADATAEVAAVRALTPGPFPLRRVGSDLELDEALDALASIDERALRLRRASRSDDGLLSTFLVRPLSRQVTRRAVGRLQPATITGFALALGVLAAAGYALGGRWWLVAGSVLLLASLVVDCVDGEVARFTRTTSPRGAWLDVGADRVKEYAVYAGLAAGVAGAGRTEWLLALAALALLVTRHFVDLGFAAGPGARVAAAQGTVGAWSARTDESAALRYAKRAVIAPVGERTILLAVLAPTVGPRWTLVAQLVVGVVAAAWTTAGRVGRALAAHQPREEVAGARLRVQVAGARLRVQVDAAPVPRRWWPVGSRLGWLLPAASRAVEQGGCTALVAWLVPTAMPGLFAWLAVVAVAEYDLTYRGRLAGASEPAGPLTWLGWPPRLVMVVLVVVAAAGAAGWLLAVGAAALALAVLASSVPFWAGQRPGARSVVSTP